MSWMLLIGWPSAHIRAEKDRSQFAGENNDLRAAMDHVSSDKVILVRHQKKKTALQTRFLT